MPRTKPKSRRINTVLALTQVIILILSSLLPLAPMVATTAQAAPVTQEVQPLLPTDLNIDGGDSVWRVNPEWLHAQSHQQGTEWHGSEADAPLVMDFGGDAQDPSIAGLDQWMAQNSGTVQAAALDADVLGTKRVMVLRVYFNDYPNASRYTKAEVEGMFDELNQLWQNTSYGKIDIAYEVSDLYQLPDDWDDYVDSSVGNLSTTAQYYKLLNDAIDNSPAGLDWTNLDAIMVVMAETGSRFHRGQANKCTLPQGPGGSNKQVGCAIFAENPSETDRQVWGRWAHEIGHAFQEGGPAHPSNYNNEFELMDSNYPGQTGVFEKQAHTGFPGWMPPSKYVELDPTKGGETICLWAMEYDPADKPNLQAAKAKITDSLYYMISVRRRVLGDDLNGDFALGIPDEGVLIERVSEGSDPWVTVQGNPGRNQLWKVNNTYVNNADGITIAVVAQPDPDTYCMRVIYGDNANQPDVMIDPWRQPPGDTWETTDIWFDSPVNGYGTYRYNFWNDLSGNLVPRGNGDDPAVGLVNRVYARVRNVGGQTATDVVVNWEITDPLGVGIAGANGWANLGSTDKNSFPGLASIAPGAFVDVYIEWTPNIELTPEQIAEGRFAFHSCVRVKINQVTGETVIGNQDGDREQENISYFQAAEEPGGGAPVYEDVVRLRNDDLVNKKSFLLGYESDLPADWDLNINNGNLSVELEPGELREIPVIIKPSGPSVIGSVFGVDINAASLRMLVNDLDPSDLHPEFVPLGGVRVEARVLLRPEIECTAENHGEVVVNGQMKGHEQYYNERTPFNMLIQGVDKERKFIPQAAHVARVNKDGSFNGVVYSQDPAIAEVICMFAGTTHLASATSGYVPVQEPGPVVTPTPDPNPQDPAKIAYVLDTDTATATEFQGYLTSKGYSVDLIHVNNVLSTNFTPYDLIIIGAETGYLNNWGTAALQVFHMIRFSKPIIGLNEGGYAFFGRMTMNIGWGNGWHGTADSLRPIAGRPIFSQPNDLTAAGNPLQVYQQPVGEVGIHVPSPIADVTVQGWEVNNDTHTPLVAERIFQGTVCHQLWGFAGGPRAMTENGRLLFLNTVEHGLNDCPARLSVRPTLTHFNREQLVKVEIGQSDNKVFNAQVSFPEAILQEVKGDDGKSYSQLLVPNVENNTTPAGQPDIPVYRRLLAVPRGAKVVLKGVEVSAGERMSDVILYPSQPDPVDLASSLVVDAQRDDPPPFPRPEPTGDDEKDAEIFADLPWQLDADAYKSDRVFPANPVEITPVGRMRDLDLVQINVAAAQYVPGKRSLQLIAGVQFGIVFDGGEGGFLPRGRLDNPFEPMPAAYELVMNYEVITKFPANVLIPNICIGSEYLIITHPDFRPAADTLRTWKVAKGISTAVVETGGSVGTTKEQIRDFIQKRYDDCLIRPSYVLLVGDDGFIPTFARNTAYTTGAATDLDYSLMAGADLVPDLALGRLPVETLAQAQTVVNKTVQYEQTPPWDNGYYNTMSFASYFQCCKDGAASGTAERAYAETSEFVRDALIGSYTVDRIYTTNGSGADTPNYYYNGALLPADLRSGSGFAWDGDAADITAAINDGLSLVYHRDHGSSSGWAHPSFKKTNVSSLTNANELPVIYSINCSTGFFDGNTSFAEEILRLADGGAAGVIAATRVSPTWANNALTRGIFDATWQDVVPGYGGTTTRRLGDIMNYGKAYMASQVGAPQTAGSVSSDRSETNYIIYHVFGDPTMKLWKSNPHPVFVPGILTAKPVLRDKLINLVYPVDGTTITALKDGLPVARGTVVNGKASLLMLSDATLDDLRFAASHPDGADKPLRLPDATGKITPSDGGGLGDRTSKVKLTFAKGAVEKVVTLFYSDRSDEESDGDGSVLIHRFELTAMDDAGAQVSHFNGRFLMEVSFTDEQLKQAGIREDQLVLAWYDEATGKWVFLETKVDGRNNVARAELDHFTEFALMSDGTPQPTGGTKNVFLPQVSNQ